MPNLTEGTDWFCGKNSIIIYNYIFKPVKIGCFNKKKKNILRIKYKLTSQKKTNLCYF